MGETRTWVIVVVVFVIVIGLIAFARGRDHHRGDDVGALGSRGAVELTVW